MMKPIAFSPEAFARARSLADSFTARLRRPALNRASQQPQAVVDGEGTAEIFIYDAIGGWWGSLTADSFRQTLRNVEGAKRLNIFVNSPGGDVFEAKAMLSQLERFKAEKVVYVDGLIASAATFLAMGADRIVTVPHGTWMIHNAWGIAAGDAAELRKYADLLDMVTGDIAGIYERRTKQELKKLRQLMDAETWMTADEALALGFTDKVATFQEDTGTAPVETQSDAAAKAASILTSTRARLEAFKAQQSFRKA